VTIDTFDKEMTLKGTKVDLRDIYEGRPFVCDSFLIFIPSSVRIIIFMRLILEAENMLRRFVPREMALKTICRVMNPLN